MPPLHLDGRAAHRAPPVRAGIVPMPVEAPDPVVQALASSGMALDESLTFVRKSPDPRTGTLREPDVIELDVGIPDDGAAVVLSEQDGVYSWILPEAAGTPARPALRAAPAAEGRRGLRFQVPVAADPPPHDGRRGPIGAVLASPIRAFILKFSVPRLVDHTVTSLEGSVRTGFVPMTAQDPREWRFEADLSGLRPRTGRAPQLLLFLHGTFSSTVGSFGALAATPWGREFLQAARSRYDAVMGFDHRTLSVTPDENARVLLAGLKTAAWTDPPEIDVVSFSRGGLVLRCLLDRLAEDGFRPTIRRAVFVDVPNDGTGLADPENWKALTELYTNLAVGALRILGPIVGMPLGSAILAESIKGLGAFIRYAAIHAIEEQAVPGLSAMRPGGVLFETLNRGTGEHAPFRNTKVYAITSEFAARLSGGDHEPAELPARFVLAAADRLAGRLFGQANDLVVDTRSMTALDGVPEDRLADRLEFGPTPYVYHTVYFTRPEVVRALGMWLDLGEFGIERAAFEDPRARRRSARSAAPAFLWDRLPPSLKTDVIELPATASLGELEAFPDWTALSFVVIRSRPDAPGAPTLRHVLSPAEMLERMLNRMASDSPRGTGLAATLDLRALPPSPCVNRSELSGPRHWGAAAVLDDGLLVGVLPGASAIPSNTDIVRRLMTPQPAALPPRPQSPPLPRSVPAYSPAPSAPKPGRVLRSGPKPRTDMGFEAMARVSSHGAGGSHGHDASGRAPGAATPVNILAECPATLVLGRLESVSVTISRDAIVEFAGFTGSAVAAAAVGLSGGQPIIVEVRARRNVECVGESRATLDPSTIHAARTLIFDVCGTHEGDGEIHVVVRQDQEALAVLRLRFRVAKAAPARHSRASAEAEVALPRHPPAGRCQELRVNERINGNLVTYEYALELPGLLFKRYVSPPITSDRAAYIKGLYQHIERRWLGSRQDQEEFLIELKSFGTELCCALFPPEMRSGLWEHRDRIAEIMIISTEPFVPWELLFLPGPGERITRDGFFLAEKGIVRWLLVKPLERELRLRRGRVGCVIPRYAHPDFRLPVAEREERDWLKDRLDAVEIVPQLAAVNRAFENAADLDALHFACHGDGQEGGFDDACLLLEGRVEDRNFVASRLYPATVKCFASFDEPSAQRPLVMLNACRVGAASVRLTGLGGFAEAFIGSGAAAFVAPLWAVDDGAAFVFTKSFYTALLDRRTLAEAATAARDAVRALGGATWLAYTVYGDPRARCVETADDLL